MASSPILCGNCGTQNAASESFCGSCGYALTEATVAVATALAIHSTPTGQLPTASLLKQRYRVLQTIGQGGMGAVYQAEDTQLGARLVAVKEMSQGNLYGQLAQDAVADFKREAHLLAGLQHPNLPSIHDYFEEAGRWYLVMSFIEGETLEDYLARMPEQKLPLEEALRVGEALCNVLHYLHIHKPPIIFRDLKPSNIMRSANGHLYLIDFGIARHFKPGQAKDTSSYGSMGYAPPEQYGKAQTTERSDIYSLGATLYECLSGYDPSQSPFLLPPLQTLVPALPEQLVTLITQMLEMEVSKRPASIKVVEQELQLVSAPAVAPKAAPRKRVLKPATPKQPTPTPPVAPIPYTPLPTSSAPTQYAPPPPITTQRGQIYLQPAPVANFTPISVQRSLFKETLAVIRRIPTPAQQSLIRKTLAVIGRILSIIGMIIGGLLSLMGFLVFFEGGFSSLWVGGLFFFFGLMIFFISRIRRGVLPVLKAKKIEAKIGMLLGILAAAFFIILVILGEVTNTPANENFALGVAVGIFIVAEGAVIWWVTRIRIKKTP